MFAGKISRNAFDTRLLKAERNLDNIIQLSDDFAYWDGQELANAVALATNSALQFGRTIGLDINPMVAGANWAEDANWNIAAGVATHTAGSADDLTQAGILEASKDYRTIVVITNRTAGSITIKYGTAAGATRSTNDTFPETVTANGADLVVEATSDFDGDVNFTEIQQTDIAASVDFPGAEKVVNGGPGITFTADDPDGWTVILEDATNKITENPSGQMQLISDGGNVRVRQTILTIGQRYRYEWIISAVATGTALLGNGATPIVQTTIPGTFVGEFTAVETIIDIKRLLSVTNYTTKSISITEANPMNGDYNGVTLGQPGNRQVRVMVEYGGAGDYTDVDSAEFKSILDPTEFALSIIVQKDTWDAAERYFFSHTVDSNNWIRCGGTSTMGQLLWEIKAGGVLKQILLASGSPTDEFQIGVQRKSNVMSAIYRGIIIDTVAITDTPEGNFDTMIIGAKNPTPNNVHLGKLAYHVHSKDKSAGQWLREAKAAGAI